MNGQQLSWDDDLPEHHNGFNFLDYRFLLTLN